MSSSMSRPLPELSEMNAIHTSSSQPVEIVLEVGNESLTFAIQILNKRIRYKSCRKKVSSKHW